MEKNNVITASNLVAEFYKEYESKKGKFLLFDLADANENANTKVLKYLLQFKNHQFLNSFLNRIGLPIPKGSITVGYQENAIGSKKTGFIDLYIQYDNEHIIIENKIYGAADTEKQLARYIATVNDIGSDFDRWYDNPYVTKNTHVVYLTADGLKEPSDNSLPKALRELVNYYPISYANDILPWLEEEVMPNLPYLEDGMMIAGVRQYIAFLKQLMTNESSEVVEEFVNSLNKKTDIEKYTVLLGAISSNNKDVPENVLKSLRKDLENRAEAIFNGDVDGGWVLHFTPSFVILYKKAWAALDTRKYSIPSLYLVGTPTKVFLEKGQFNKVCAQVDHLPIGLLNQYPTVKSGNHGKTAEFDLTNKISGISCDANDSDSRKEFYKQIINACNDKITLMDDAVAQAINNAGADKPQTELLKHLAK